MIDLKFNDHIESKYKYIGEFHEGLARVQNPETEKWGYIDKQGNEVIPCQFEDAYDFSEGLAATKKLSGWGYIDKDDKIVIGHNFKYVRNFSEGLAAVKDERSSNWYYIDKCNMVKSQGDFEHVYDYHDGRAVVYEKDGTAALADINGEYECTFDYVSNFEDGVSVIRQSTKFMTVDKDLVVQKALVDSGLSQLSDYISCGMFRVSAKPGVGYLDKNLELKIPAMYRSGRDFSDNMAVVSFGGDTISIIDKNGKNITFSKKYQYSQIKDFSEGLAAVKNAKTGLWGYINKQGKEVIPCQYEEADNFSEGLAGVLDVNERLCYINKRGTIKIKIDKEYTSVLNLDDKSIYITANNEEEFNNKKLKVLNLVKEECIKQIVNNVNDISSDIINEMYETSKRKKLN